MTPTELSQALDDTAMETATQVNPTHEDISQGIWEETVSHLGLDFTHEELLCMTKRVERMIPHVN